MPPIDNLLVVVLAGLALSVTPGPSMLYVLSRSMAQGRAAGLVSAFGLCLGGMLLAVATALGLASIFERFEWISVTLRYVGSCYLIWLAVGMIRSAGESLQLPSPDAPARLISLSKVFLQGVLVELLNPKTVFFFALFLPPFVEPATFDSVHDNLQMQLLVLGMIVPVTAIPSDLFVAFLGGTLVQKARKNTALRVGLAWFGGLALIAIAINLNIRFL
jgi:threonine/homoserine/homoserine lactone efflux protein